MILIKNGYVMTMAGDDIPNGSVLINDSGKIEAVGQNIEEPDNCTVIDAEGRLVTPGCIEAHSHIGLRIESLGWEGSEINESSSPITPHMRAIDGINPNNEYFYEAIKGGVTTGCVGPGSSNVVCGTFSIVKYHGNSIDKMVVKNDVAMKCALGENPKSTKKAPKTRMGSAALFRELLFKAKAYQQEKDSGKEPKFDMKLEAMLPVMRKEIPLKCHAHRADDIFTSIRIAKEFDLKLTLDHCTEGALIADELAEEGYPALVGPMLWGRSKPEVKNKSHATAGVLHKAGVKIAIITDAPVIMQEKLPFCAGLAVVAGLPYQEGWKAITINPAEILGVDDRLGSLERGKDADIVIWTEDPLKKICASAYTTIINGQVVYQK